MTKLFKNLIVVTLTIFAFTAQSDPRGWIDDVEVFRVVVVVNGGVNVRVIPDLEGCVSQSGYGGAFASVLPTHPGVDKIYAALLAAKLSGEKVSLYLADDNCTVGEMVVGGYYNRALPNE